MWPGQRQRRDRLLGVDPLDEDVVRVERREREEADRRLGERLRDRGEDADRVQRERAVELQEHPAALELELDAVDVGRERRSSHTIDSSSVVRVIET